MARPREFDERDALTQAVGVFWNKGYEGTSMADLLAATGLSKSSLYETFGSKRDLFMAALSAYCDDRTRLMRDHLQSRDNALDAIAGFLALVVEQARRDDRPFGCLSCNEAAEMAPHDSDVRRILARDFDGMEAAFAEAINRGHADGSIPPDREARRYARFLNVTYHGLQIMARTRSVERMEDAVQVALSALR